MPPSGPAMRSNVSIINNSSRTMDDAFDFESHSPATHNYFRKRIIQTVVDLIVIIIIFIIFGLVYAFFPPKIRYFTCDQSDIFFPYKEDTIPFWSVGIYATIGPILFIIPVELLNAQMLPLQTKKHEMPRKLRIRKFFVCTFHALSLFALGIALTLCLTEIGKRWVIFPEFIYSAKAAIFHVYILVFM